MISASKAIMALAAKGKYQMDESCRAIQNQTVTVNVQQHPATTVTTQHTPPGHYSGTPASVITNTNPHTPAPPITPSSFQPAGQEPVNEEPVVVERDIVLEPAIGVNEEPHEKFPP